MHQTRLVSCCVTTAQCGSQPKEANILHATVSIISILSIHDHCRIPEYRGCGFNLPRGKPLLEKWLAIPEDTDILVTHTPPLGHGDFTKGRQHVGCQDLLNVLQERVKPKYHVFGHIHEGNVCLYSHSIPLYNSSVLLHAFVFISYLKF